MGGTMRCGQRKTIFKEKNSIMYKLYGSNDSVSERHRHRWVSQPYLFSEEYTENNLLVVTYS